MDIYSLENKRMKGLLDVKEHIDAREDIYIPFVFLVKKQILLATMEHSQSRNRCSSMIMI
jgi:hypothetical protein